MTARVLRCRLPFLDVTVGVVLGSTGTLLVDSGSTLSEAEAIRDDIRALTPRPVGHVVLTHKHFDHILGSSVFAGAEIYCALEVVEVMADEAASLRSAAVGHGADPAEIDRALGALRIPRHPVPEAVIDLGEVSATVSHPGGGHTGHDLIVAASGAHDAVPTVVFCGDLVEESADPAIDSDSDLAAWPATLDRVLAAGGPDGLFVPGHGAVVDAAFVLDQRDWLRARSAPAAPGPEPGGTGIR